MEKIGLHYISLFGVNLSHTFSKSLDVLHRQVGRHSVLEFIISGEQINVTLVDIWKFLLGQLEAEFLQSHQCPIQGLVVLYSSCCHRKEC